MAPVYTSVQLTRREVAVVHHILSRHEIQEFTSVTITLDQYELRDFKRALNTMSEAMDNHEFKEELKE